MAGDFGCSLGQYGALGHGKAMQQLCSSTRMLSGGEGGPREPCHRVRKIIPSRRKINRDTSRRERYRAKYAMFNSPQPPPSPDRLGGRMPRSTVADTLPAYALTAVLCAAFVLSGCAGRLNTSEKMMLSTYPLITQRGAATGFIINHRDASVRGGVVPVLFTSVHVLETMGDGPLFIGTRLPDAPAGTPDLYFACLPPKSKDGKKFYVRHPLLDIAAFPIDLPPEFKGLPGLPSYLDESMLAHAGKQIRTGVEVAFLGYPAVLPGTDGGFPVLRSGRIASYPVGAAQSHGFFLINSDVCPGDSGAPVFLAARGSRPRLAGMIIERIGEDARTFSHLAIAVDADMIRETLALVPGGNASDHHTRAVQSLSGKR